MDKGKKRSAHADLFGTRELGRRNRCAVIVAHPDDEVIGAGGLISRLRDVTVLHITDGVPESPNVSEASNTQRAEKVQVLNRECRAALALANIASEHVVEFGLVAYQAPLQLADLTRRIASFLRHNAPDTVLTHPYEGGHPDHDATAFATHAALRLLRRQGFRPPSLFEIALHPARDGQGRVLDFLPSVPAEVTTLLLDEKARDLKQQMFACFTNPLEPLRETSFGCERFRRPPKYDFAAPPNDEKMNYEEFASGLSSDDWQALVSKAWSNLFPGEQTH